LLTQIAKMRGARVITTVGTDAKAKLSREAGADEVCVYTRDDFVDAVRRFTNGRGVDVAYDAVGASTFEGTLKSLRPRGVFVSYGNASGPVPPFSPLALTNNGSLFFTRPSLKHYTTTTAELRARTNDLFAWIEAGQLNVRIGATYPLTAAAEAHRALEARQTTGKVLLQVVSMQLIARVPREATSDIARINAHLRMKKENSSEVNDSHPRITHSFEHPAIV
jgi:NADPH2:quinone reductase